MVARVTGPSPAAVEWARIRVLAMHREVWNPHRATGGCAQCGPDGCPLLDEAEVGTVGADNARAGGAEPE